jgi:triosephosphate isomerase
MIIAANFKTNMTRRSTGEYLKELNAYLRENRVTDTVMVFPPATALDRADGDVIIGAQNAYGVKSGAFTGELGLEQLSEFDISTILIGHSERRHVLGETQEEIVLKYNFYKEQAFEIVYCIGEPLEIREKGIDAVMEYLLAQFEGIDTTYNNLIVAYEPIWAIGTGRSATVEEISTTHQALKKAINNKPLLYGGSAKPANIKEIVSIDGVDGVLVGSASLDTDSFSKMVLA